MRTICTQTWKESCLLVYVFPSASLLGWLVLLDMFFQLLNQLKTAAKVVFPRQISTTTNKISKLIPQLISSINANFLQRFCFRRNDVNFNLKI